MISYRDITFCSFYKECKNGEKCERALTEEVLKKAREWWGDKHAPIARFTNKPDCYILKKGTT